jgi:protein-tyrosine phosphatase
MIKVLFVCLGNICRSPLAEGLFIKLIKDNSFESKLICDSAGTASYHIGELADSRTRKNAESHNINLVHKARQFKPIDYDEFDYILVMDESNLNNIDYIKTKQPKAKVFKMRYFDYDFKDEDVPDPYYMGEDGFENVFKILERSTNNFMEFLKQEHKF